jgi:hypothetical protein
MRGSVCAYALLLGTTAVTSPIAAHAQADYVTQSQNIFLNQPPENLGNVALEAVGNPQVRSVAVGALQTLGVPATSASVILGAAAQFNKRTREEGDAVLASVPPGYVACKVGFHANSNVPNDGNDDFTPRYKLQLKNGNLVLSWWLPRRRIGNGGTSANMDISLISIRSDLYPAAAASGRCGKDLRPVIYSRNKNPETHWQFRIDYSDMMLFS